MKIIQLDVIMSQIQLHVDNAFSGLSVLSTMNRPYLVFPA